MSFDHSSSMVHGSTETTPPYKSSSSDVSADANNLMNRGNQKVKRGRDSITQTEEPDTDEDLESLQEVLPEDSNMGVASTFSRSEEVQTRQGSPDEDLESLHQILPEDSNIQPESQDIEKTISSKEVSRKDTAFQSIFKEIRLLSILSFFAIIGVLARKGIIALTTYDGAYVGGVIWANFTACIIMGMLIQSSRAWSLYGGKASVPLYVGLTTGFCGTFSSFSSLVLEAFEKSADVTTTHYHYPNAAYGIMECASVMITQMGVSIAGLHFGKHMIKQYDPVIWKLDLVQNAIFIGGILAWIAVICLIVIESWRPWTFACIVSPIACWTRYYVSKWLNPRIKRFPLGTFTVNIFATIVLAFLTLVNRGKLANGGRIVNTVLSCHMIKGLEDGYCATLSTVSTFVVELYTIKSPMSYRYGAVSLLVAYAFVVITLGSYNWTIGLTEPLCS